ncbi:16S rRNA processing protein RimM [Steroidobacter denitrificans]|uniref:Ribosome maturation factor RimM n=1 Tax=Steroidobacter denitrificans TaxID=465721 RepID=A0A127FA58_STEDE|nr:16S rRNA processing protein RimM [Steroidobacter denitrificans]
MVVPDPERIVVLGSIGAPFGVQGWVKVRSYTEPLENILNYGVWQLGRAGQWQSCRLEDGRITGKGVLAKLARVDTPEAARLHTGADIGVARSELPPPPPGEHYWSDLEGLEALGSDGSRLGRVDHFRATPAGHVVVIKGAREHWIPFTKDRILKVELDAGRIVFDWAADWS